MFLKRKVVLFALNFPLSRLVIRATVRAAGGAHSPRVLMVFCVSFFSFWASCCCLHIKNHSDLYSVLCNIRTCSTDANAFRGHRLTIQKGTYYEKLKEIKGPGKVEER